MIEEYGGDFAAKAAAERMTGFGRYRVKSQDLSRFLADRIWEQESLHVSPTPAPFCTEGLGPQGDGYRGKEPEGRLEPGSRK